MPLTEKDLEILATARIEQPRSGFGGPHPEAQITLAELYKAGWWITEIFGTKANCVRQNSQHYRKIKGETITFGSIQRNVVINNPKVFKVIAKIKNERWKQYKHRMLNDSEN